ncbi:MAG: hypothetical protein AAGA66_03635 [Bacteroidota bacterium]
MRFTLSILLLLSFSFVFAQSPFEFQSLVFENKVPASLTSSRTAVIIDLKKKNESSYTTSGDWKKTGNEAHGYLYKMGVDPVIYLNLLDYQSGNSTKGFYMDLLSNRGAEFIVFLKEVDDGFELICTKFDPQENLFKSGQSAFRYRSGSLKSVLLNFAREIKKSDQFPSNFLIPEKPFFANEIPIVEKLNLKNYPGQIRRSNLAIEKFAKVAVPKNGAEEMVKKINAYNLKVDAKNEELEQILQELQKELEYEFKFIDHMSDEDLLRKRHQFLLRNVYASVASIRSLLKYEDEEIKDQYMSVIPIMPDNTSVKSIPKDALVHKFYIRQNIVKNVYVGEWDASETWQDALRNYIRNMIQYFNKGN